MAMTILFRKRRTENLFREALLEMIEESPGDTLVLSSGYLTEGALYPKNDLTTRIAAMMPDQSAVKILGGNFRQCNSCKNNHHSNCNKCKKNSINVNGTFKTCGYCDYLEFVDVFGKQLNSSSSFFNKTMNIQAYYSPFYHAKVAFKVQHVNGIPEVTAGIIGSSNLSKSGFEFGNYWSNECDIYMFLDQYYEKSKFWAKEYQEEVEDFAEASLNEAKEIFFTRMYNFDIIPVDSRIPDRRILERLYDELKGFFDDQYLLS